MIELMEAPAATRTLAKLETIIERGLEIQQRKLYRATHQTFEDYCRGRWGISRPRAYQLLGAAHVVSTVVDRGLPAPRTERVARELAPMLAEPETLTAVWSEAVGQSGPEPTAAEVRAVVGIGPAAPRPRIPALRLTRARVNKALRTLEGTP